MANTIRTRGFLPRLKMPYGKWKGHYLDELPHQYLNWLLVNCVNEDGETTLPLGVHCAVQAILANANGGAAVGGPVTSPARRPRPTNPDNEYAVFLSEQMAAGGWSPSFRTWGRALGLRASTVLAHLLSLGKVRADANGWIPAGNLLDELGLDLAAADKVLDRLADAGVIEVQHRHGQRAVRVDLDRLRAAVEEVTS